MNTFEKNTTIDTSLSGGMVAVAFAWALFAALHGPVGTQAGSDAGARGAQVAVSGAAASHRSATPEAAGRTVAVAKVS